MSPSSNSFASQIHSKLFLGNAKEAIDMILLTQKERGFAIVHFLYYANAYFANLYRGVPTEKNTRYFDALLQSDVLLPDGIALSLVHYKRMHQAESGWSIFRNYQDRAKKSLQNLNGTDLTPELLQTVAKNWNPKKVTLVMYGTFPEIIAVAGEKISKEYGFDVRAKDGYSPFDFSLFSERKKEDELRIVLVGQGSPRQELFVEEHREYWINSEAIVITVGGLFDFWGWREKRAPEIVRKFRLEWLWRLLANPRKNTKKVFASLSCFRELFFPKKEQ